MASVLFASRSGLGAAVGLVALIVAELLAFGRRNPETAPSPTAAVPEPAGPGARTDSELTS